ncbi:MAG: archaeosortase/exosortase family protein [Candidatus Micrarchaeia archaeon]
MRKKRKALKKFSLRESEKQFLIKFFLIFFALFLLIHAFDLAPFTSDVSTSLKTAIASLEQKLLHFAGFQVFRNAEVLYAGVDAYQVVIECTGLVLVALLAALLYSTDLKEKERRRALLLYTPFLLVFNIARLFVTLYSGVAFGRQTLEIVHPVLWIVDSLVVLALWAFSAKIRV